MIVKPVVGLYGVLEKTEQGWQHAEGTVAEVGRQLAAAGLSVKTAPELVADDPSATRTARIRTCCWRWSSPGASIT
jgi:hypothetical protein